MRVFMSVDMEGITGVVNRAAVMNTHPEYNRFRMLMTQDVNAAVEGAISAGANEVIVADSHGWMHNIIIEELHEKARLISGSNRQLCQMGGIDDYKFDAVFFVGYHGREGSKAVINHTLMGSAVTQIKVNGKEVGETALNAGIAGHYGLPVVLVTGDDIVAAEAIDNLGDVETVIVKRAMDRFVADCLPPKLTHELIKNAAQRSLNRLKEFKPYIVESPVTIELTFKTTPEASICTLFPTITQTDSKTISIIADDYVTGFKQLWGCLILGHSADGGLFK